MAYRFIQENHKIFGVRWLLRRLNLVPNAYYNYLKNKKSNYYEKKEKTLSEIAGIYHEHEGVDGYRSIRVFLERKNIRISAATAHKYMNKELQLYSIVRKKKPNYEKGTPHKVFENLINQDFSLAIRTVKKALESQPKINKNLILHSDQGSQYTSKAFIEFCESSGITQSMSKAGCPYDNSPMERYYNTLKNERLNLHYYHTDEELNTSIEEFAYIWYNHVRPHTYNDYRTPFEARNEI